MQLSKSVLAGLHVQTRGREICHAILVPLTIPAESVDLSGIEPLTY